MNFPFFYQTLLMLQPYFQAGEPDRATEVIQQLARNTADRLDYFDSLDEEIINTSYRREVSQARNIVQQLLLQLRVSGSPELRSSVEAILGNHLYLLPDQENRLPG
jgi:hypothetical protein